MLAKVKSNMYNLHAHKIQNVQLNGNQGQLLVILRSSTNFVSGAHLPLNIEYERGVQIAK